MPHVLKFGETLPILDREELIQKKIEIVDSLIEIETAYSILQDHTEDENQNPIDQNYEKLKTKINVLDRKTDEFQIIQEYVEKTHAKTHTDYTLEINNVFVIERHREAKKYKELVYSLFTIYQL